MAHVFLKVNTIKLFIIVSAECGALAPSMMEKYVTYSDAEVASAPMVQKGC